MGETADCGPIDHTVTQADIDLGYVHNEATATGQPPTGGQVPRLPSTIDIPSLPSTTGLGIIKQPP